MTLVCVPYIILIRDEPPNQIQLVSENFKEQVQDSIIEESYCQKLKVGFKNGNYILLATVFSLMVGINTAFGINIDPIFGPIGFTTSQISLLGFACVIMGVASSMISGVLLRLFR